jgi:type IV fimbrial biogenesis protein FimT
VRQLIPTDGVHDSRQRGFTLIELVITMSIVAILLAIGIPSFRYVTTSNRTSGEINDLLGSMQLARAEAIKQGQTVTICASQDHLTCSGQSSWNTGWIMFAGTGAPSNADPIIRLEMPFSGSDTLQANGTPAASAVEFNREGFGLNLPAGGLMFTLHDSTGGTSYTRCLQVTFVGAVSTLNYNGGSCT